MNEQMGLADLKTVSVIFVLACTVEKMNEQAG